MERNEISKIELNLKYVWWIAWQGDKDVGRQSLKSWASCSVSYTYIWTALKHTQSSSPLWFPYYPLRKNHWLDYYTRVQLCCCYDSEFCISYVHVKYNFQTVTEYIRERPPTTAIVWMLSQQVQLCILILHNQIYNIRQYETSILNIYINLHWLILQLMIKNIKIW